MQEGTHAVSRLVHSTGRWRIYENGTAEKKIWGERPAAALFWTLLCVRPRTAISPRGHRARRSCSLSSVSSFLSVPHRSCASGGVGSSASGARARRSSTGSRKDKAAEAQPWGPTTNWRRRATRPTCKLAKDLPLPPTLVRGPSGKIYHSTSIFCMRPAFCLRNAAIHIVESSFRTAVITFMHRARPGKIEEVRLHPELGAAAPHHLHCRDRRCSRTA